MAEMMDPDVGMKLLDKMVRMKAYIQQLDENDRRNFASLVELPVHALKELRRKAVTPGQKEFVSNALTLKACLILTRD